MAGDAVAERLSEYQRKRDFGRTPEPAGGPGTAPAAGGAPRFVVQRHRARRLHYDVRLEIDGVLVSWAVPKGPTLDPKARQLAVHVEDHPIEYFDFEGVIPAGEYGGGDVIVWDWGTWAPGKEGDPRRCIDDEGELHVDLFGEKLRGRFVFVRTERRGKGQWLLLHKNDGHAVPGWDPEDHPRSVKSGRTNDEVATDPEFRWRSDAPAAEAAERVRAEWAPATAEEVAALEALGKSGTWLFQGRELAVTNLDKVLFPGRDGGAAVTKRDLVRYWALVAPFALRYLAARPVNLHRYPNGVGTPGFWHKEVPDHAPEWLTRWRNEDADRGETQVYAVLDEPPAAVWAANFGAIELHPWTSTIPEVRRPTWVFFDVDPGPATPWEDVLALARLHRTALEHLGVTACPQVTGKRGVQVWVPIAPGPSFDETRAWAETVSRAIGATVPDLISWEWRKDERGGKARLDYTQNAINKTLVCPYSPRPAPGAPVATPITWDELDDPELRPDRWTIRTVLDRLLERGDPMAQVAGRPQRLPTF